MYPVIFVNVTLRTWRWNSRLWQQHQIESSM